MDQIPPDAAHWDSGDWIEWHRVAAPDITANRAAASDFKATLTAMQVNLLSCARGYWRMTGEHLPVYDAIARVHGALQHDLPMHSAPDGTFAGVKISVLPPHSAGNTVSIDLTTPFSALLMVRISDNFTVSGRMVSRSRLRTGDVAALTLSWAALPSKD